MNDIKVSIIMPAYNVAHYISKGIESVLEQTHKNVELIIVNDGSTDDTLNVINAYCYDKRIITINQNNKGVSAARNNALKQLSGDFFLFLDADDWLEHDTVEKMLSQTLENKGYIVCCDRYFVRCGEDGEIERKRAKKDADIIVGTAEDVIKSFGTDTFSAQSSCYKLFPASIVNEKHISFDETLHYGEDGFFTYEAVKNSKGMIYIPFPGWNILERENSATNGEFNRKWLTAVAAVDKMIAQSSNCEECEILQAYRMRRVIGVINSLLMSSTKDTDSFKTLRSELKLNFNEINNKHLSKKHRCMTLAYIGIPYPFLRILWRIAYK